LEEGGGVLTNTEKESSGITTDATEMQIEHRNIMNGLMPIHPAT
jgi:hypothetical protein